MEFEKKISRIVYGCCNSLLNNGQTGAEEFLEEVFKLGINAFDTARQYNESENTIGKWIDKYGRREEVVLVTKGCHPDSKGSRLSSECLLHDLEESLRCLRTDYIDIYMLHRDDLDCDVPKIIELFNELKTKGKLKSFGVSNWTTDRISLANEYAYKHNLEGFSFSSPQFSVLEQVKDPWGWNCVTIGGKANREQREWYRLNRTPVFAWSSLAGGMASGKVKSYNLLSLKRKLGAENYGAYVCVENLKKLRTMEKIAKKRRIHVSQVALSWLMSQGLDVYPICTSTNIGRIKLMKEALDIKLSEDEIKSIAPVD